MTTTNKSPSGAAPHRQRKSTGSVQGGGDLGPDSDIESTGSSSTADKLLGNELRAHKNRGFHDGYDAGKKATLQGAYDGGYKRAFEQNFILSTLKGVANALKSSHQHSMQQAGGAPGSQSSRPTSAISSSSTSSSSAATPSKLASSSSSSSGGNLRRVSTSNETTITTSDHHHHHHHNPTRSSKPQASLLTSSQQSTRRRMSSPYSQSRGGGLANSAASSVGGDDVASTCSSSSISSNRSSTAGGGCYSSTNVSISSNHLSLLDSMKFDATSDIESIKKDLITICRENRLEILAHYVSQIG